jgi:hypothetical protein
MLDVLEARWLFLEKQLLDFILDKDPTLQSSVEEWLQAIHGLPIQERTLYFTEITTSLLEGLTTDEEMEDWLETKKTIIKQNKIKDVNVLNVFETHIDKWIHLNRKRG